MAAFLPSCSKESSKSSSTLRTNLVLSKTSVKMGEALQVSVATQGQSFIRWRVSPDHNLLILPAGNNTTILFSSPGTYQVTASYFADSMAGSPYDSSSAPVIVTDSVYYPPTPVYPADTLSLAGDQLTLQPVSLNDSGLVMLVQTQHAYSCSPSFVGYSYGQANSALEMSFDYVSEGNSASCNGAKNPASAYLFFPLLTSGQYPVKLELNHVIYQGSLEVTPTTYTFNWSYTSGVLIAPLQILRK